MAMEASSSVAAADAGGGATSASGGSSCNVGGAGIRRRVLQAMHVNTIMLP